MLRRISGRGAAWPLAQNVVVKCKGGDTLNLDKILEPAHIRSLQRLLPTRTPHILFMSDLPPLPLCPRLRQLLISSGLVHGTERWEQVLCAEVSMFDLARTHRENGDAVKEQGMEDTLRIACNHKPNLSPTSVSARKLGCYTSTSGLTSYICTGSSGTAGLVWNVQCILGGWISTRG